MITSSSEAGLPVEILEPTAGCVFRGGGDPKPSHGIRAWLGLI